MNFPGATDNNWGWRCQPDSLNDWLRDRLAHLTELYARWIPMRAVPLKGQGNV